MSTRGEGIPSIRTDKRIVGRLGKPGTGPLLLLTGGIHGNEPAGVAALEQIVAELKPHEASLRGRIVAIRGNLRALQQEQRYIDADLNRIWEPNLVEQAMNAGHSIRTADLFELRGVLEVIEEETRTQRDAVGHDHPVVAIDLHSTSGEGPPFLVMSDHDLDLALRLDLPVPAILGLEDKFHGTMIAYLREYEIAGVAFEGGANANPRTIRFHKAIIWRTLQRLGIIPPDHVYRNGHPYPRAARSLVRATEGLPHFVRIAHRHGIDPTDKFEMQAGFRNFQRIEEGQVLAHDRRGPVTAQRSGILLMPLYQPQGDDGYFIGDGIEPQFDMPAMTPGA